jgi:hypothetical protein
VFCDYAEVVPVTSVRKTHYKNHLVPCLSSSIFPSLLVFNIFPFPVFSSTRASNLFFLSFLILFVFCCLFVFPLAAGWARSSLPVSTCTMCARSASTRRFATTFPAWRSWRRIRASWLLLASPATPVRPREQQKNMRGKAKNLKLELEIFVNSVVRVLDSLCDESA